MQGRIIDMTRGNYIVSASASRVGHYGAIQMLYYYYYYYYYYRKKVLIACSKQCDYCETQQESQAD